MGGSDQWGNITAGIELTRRKIGTELFAVTSPLITKADGKKFGKTEEGNVWLEASLTSSYKFYQFWLNVSDEEASRYIRIFTLLEKEEIESLEEKHNASPHLRLLQQALAKDITIRIVSSVDLKPLCEFCFIIFVKMFNEFY
jgi:tyrosyl-tRNA synthetase